MKTIQRGISDVSPTMGQTHCEDGGPCGQQILIGWGRLAALGDSVSEQHLLIGLRH